MATDDKTLKRFMGKHFTIYIMTGDQWLQFFSHFTFKETRDRCMIRTSRTDVKIKCSCNTISLTLTYVIITAPPFSLPHSPFLHAPKLEAWPFSSSFTDRGHVISAGLHQFQRQRSVCDPVPSAVCVQPHIFSVRAQSQSQVHLWSLLCEEMST